MATATTSVEGSLRGDHESQKDCIDIDEVDRYLVPPLLNTRTTTRRRLSSTAGPRMRLPASPSPMVSISSPDFVFSRTLVTLAAFPPVVRLFIIGMVVSLPGLLYGLDTGSIGPVTEMEQFKAKFGSLSSGLQGFFVASILLSAAASSLCSGYIADRISRRFGIGTGAGWIVLGASLSAASPNLACLFVARIITGIGAGQTVAVASVYAIEISTVNVRGKLGCIVQLMITCGIAIGYWVCFATSKLQSNMSWRTPFILQAAIAALLAAAIFIVVPFSPRWLVSMDRQSEALAVLRQLRITTNASSSQRQEEEQLAQAELAEIQAAVEATRHASGRKASYAELFYSRYRHRTLLGLFIMCVQQLSGIDVVLYYAPVVFASIFNSQSASFLASGVSGIVLVISTVPAQIWMDRWGRRLPMILGGAVMALCFFLIGIMFAKYGEQEKTEDGTSNIILTNNAVKGLVVAMIYLFISAFSITWAPINRIYASEIVPNRLRSRAAALQQLANWATNFSVALVAPLFLAASPSGPYFLFAGCLIVATAVMFVFVKETKGKTLEGISQMFEHRPM